MVEFNNCIPVAIRNSIFNSGVVTNLFWRAMILIRCSSLGALLQGPHFPALILTFSVWLGTSESRDIALFDLPKNPATAFWDSSACNIPIACQFCSSVGYTELAFFSNEDTLIDWWIYTDFCTCTACYWMLACWDGPVYDVPNLAALWALK